MSSRQFRIALIQMAVRPDDLEGNLNRARGKLADAASQGASLALLPECFDLGWCSSAARSEAGLIPEGRSCQILMQSAREHRIYVCGGITERSGDRICNAAVLISPNGELLLHHRKIHELDIAETIYSRGDRLGVIETEMGILGLMICADGFADGLVLSKSLGQMGAQLILSPCAWAVPNDHNNESDPYGQLWRDSYGPVCTEFGCSIIGVSNVGRIGGGEWKDRPCIGSSLAVGLDGEDILQAPYGDDAECILYVEWDGASLRPIDPPA